MTRRSRGRSAVPAAAALKYVPSKDSAPRVTAKGRGWIAEKILSLAREHGVPIREDADLVEILASLELDQEIPPECYAAVAEILAFVYSLNQRFQAASPRGGTGS